MLCNDALVSIIMPVYNKERYINETINSVIKQTYVNFELILIDDCSEDLSYKIMQSFLKSDKRIKYIRLKENSGAAVARNKGIDIAKGRYIAFLDADDIWSPLKLETQLEFMKTKGVGFTYAAIEMINGDGKVVKNKRKIKDVVDYKYLLTNTVIACSSVMIDRSIINNLKMIPIRKGQDYATWLLLTKKGYKAYGIDEALVKYRIVGNSISSNKFSAMKRTYDIYRKVEHLNVLLAHYYFIWYLYNAIIKYYL